MATSLPKITTTRYRYDVDWLAGRSCNGTDLFSDDYVEIGSTGDRVTFAFKNETDLPTWFPLYFDKSNGLHWVEYPDSPADRRFMAVPFEHSEYILEALRCAISLESDPVKKSALQQVLSLVEGAQGVSSLK